MSRCGGGWVETVRGSRLFPSWGRVPARRGRPPCERDGGARSVFPLRWGRTAEGQGGMGAMVAGQAVGGGRHNLDETPCEADQ